MKTHKINILRNAGNELDFKELFKLLTSAGVGRPVDGNGFPDSAWTPELLSKAISEVDPGGSGVDLRTIQLWFQDNDKGIGPENIRVLARVFGGNDPETTSQFQVALSAAQRRLVAKRRKVRSTDANDSTARMSRKYTSEATPVPPVEIQAGNAAKKRAPHSILSMATESLFGGSSLDLPTVIFGVAVVLGFLSFFFGIHDATYATIDGLEKQVGYLWAPNWTILFLILMPLFFFYAIEIVSYWKLECRAAILHQTTKHENITAWHDVVNRSYVTFWLLFFICFLFAGAFQWYKSCVQPLFDGSIDSATDWSSLTLRHPEIISKPETIIFTGLAYLYMCTSFYMFFAALTLLYCVSKDYNNAQNEARSSQSEEINTAACVFIVRRLYRCTILGIFIAILMRVQNVYLSTGSTNIISWLLEDLKSAFISGGASLILSKNETLTHFTSLIVVLALLFVFLYGVSRLGIGRRFRTPLILMLACIGLLTLSYILIGAFVGFSAFLGTAMLIAICDLINPGFGAWKTPGREGNKSAL